MSYRTIACITAAALIGIACVSTEASARGGRAAGVHHGGARVAGVHRGGVYHGGAYARRGVAVGVGAAAVGAAVAAPYYNQCGVYPYPPCY
jgi:hypothetical protein